MKTRILFLIDSLKFGGGAEKVVSSLSFNLPKNYELFLLTIKHFKMHYPFQGEHYSLKEKSLKSFNFFNRPIRLFKHIRLIKPDIIISFSEITNIFLIFTKFIFRLNIPIIISVQCNPLLQYRKEQKFINFLIKLFYPLKIANEIIAISKGVNKILQKSYHIPERKIKTIYNAIDIETIDKLKDQNISVKKGIFQNENLIKFVNVGRFRKVKGHVDLIKAFSKVKTEIPNSVLILIGDGELKKEVILQRHKYGLENNVILLGIQKNPFKYLNKSDIFVLSSKYEGFPTVLLEALACGIPIISTDCRTGPREILQSGKYGLLVEVNNINDLADKMIKLAKNKVLRKKYSKLSRKRAFDFQWKESREKLIKLIKQNINSS